MSTTKQPINVLLVDDHTILRQGLKQLLETDSQLHICGEAENGEEALAKAFSLKPDIILMDINLPKINGYEASRAILSAWPQARILVLTNQDDAHVLKKFLDLGVKGFLLKDVQLELLLDTIHRIVAGETVELSSDLSEKMAALKVFGKENTVFSLTDREKEVLKALARGYSNQQLAELLVVSPKTVHNHLYSIYSKIGVNTRSEAIVWAIESGFVEK
jgi:DNA-binding NarL/FixJ family response regulator